MAHGEAVRREVTVCNPLGLHMRPATAFAQKARNFQSRVTVWHGDKPADGKSSLDLILLIAMPGATLALEVIGPDAADAMAVLAEILAAPGDGE